MIRVCGEGLGFSLSETVQNRAYRGFELTKASGIYGVSSGPHVDRSSLAGCSGYALPGGRIRVFLSAIGYECSCTFRFKPRV